jgi:hypothetical protein
MVGRREGWLDVEEHTGGIYHGFGASKTWVIQLQSQIYLEYACGEYY